MRDTSLHYRASCRPKISQKQLPTLGETFLLARLYQPAPTKNHHSTNRQPDGKCNTKKKYHTLPRTGFGAHDVKGRVMCHGRSRAKLCYFSTIRGCKERLRFPLPDERMSALAREETKATEYRYAFVAARRHAVDAGLGAKASNTCRLCKRMKQVRRVKYATRKEKNNNKQMSYPTMYRENASAVCTATRK